MSYIKYIICIIVVFLYQTCGAVDYYLAPDGNDSNDGSINSPWKSLDYALDPRLNDMTSARVDGGDGNPDTLYLRGGVYDCSAMTSYNSITGPEIYPNNNESDATLTIKSYPGEWAILDGTGLNHAVKINNYIYNVTFENFEIRNAKRYGIDAKHDQGDAPPISNNCIFRNLYIHDNNKETGENPAGNNPAGILIAAQDTIIEYCTFKDNGTLEETMHNATNLCLMQDYNTSDTNVDDNPRKNNIIRYNVFDGAGCGIKDKAYGNFVDSADPKINNPSWYGEIHHNIFKNAWVCAYYARQDYRRFHHNLIFTSSGDRGYFYDEHDDTPPKGWFNNKIYNNTFVGAYNCIWIDISNYTSAGYDADIYNNLFIDTTDISIYLWVGQTNTWDITIDHNGYDNDNATIADYLNDGDRTLAQWKVYGYGTDSLFEALSIESDYTLPVGSNAIGAGRDGADLGAFPSGGSSWYDSAGYYGVVGGNNASIGSGATCKLGSGTTVQIQ